MRAHRGPARGRARLARSLAVGTAVLLLGGCGLGGAVVGLHDAPAEQTSGAPVSQQSARQIARRVLTLAAVARAAEGDGAGAKREAALTGPALRAASVPARYRDTGTEASAVTRPPQPTVLAVSRGRQWPRAVLATTRQDGTQRLHALVSTSATEPFRLFATVTMQPGARVPALGDLAAGAPLVTGDSGLVVGPRRALADYGRALRVPPPEHPPTTVSTRDAFATALRASTRAEQKGLGRLARLTRRHRLGPGDVLAFRLSDGGAIVFGQLTRTDTVRASSKAKKLLLPRDLAELAGTRSVGDHVTVTTLETAAMTIPSSRDAPSAGRAPRARAVGVDEQRASVRGR